MRAGRGRGVRSCIRRHPDNTCAFMAVPAEIVTDLAEPSVIAATTLRTRPSQPPSDTNASFRSPCRNNGTLRLGRTRSHSRVESRHGAGQSRTRPFLFSGMPRLCTHYSHSVQCIYDYYLGGKDNFAVDREAGEFVIASRPGLRESVRANRAFLGRVVRLLAGELRPTVPHQARLAFMTTPPGLPARALAPSEEALDTPLSPPPHGDEPGPATGRSGAYPDRTHTCKPGPAFRTQHGSRVRPLALPPHREDPRFGP